MDSAARKGCCRQLNRRCRRLGCLDNVLTVLCDTERWLTLWLSDRPEWHLRSLASRTFSVTAVEADGPLVSFVTEHATEDFIKGEAVGQLDAQRLSPCELAMEHF